MQVFTRCCGQQARSVLREGVCGATQGWGQLIRLCLKEGVVGYNVEGRGGAGQYVLAESRPEGMSDQKMRST